MSSSMWVFGYGSLMWNPGFEYLDSKLGFIKGYTRRFWQGNDFHRGTPDKPGRVVTLVEDTEGITWGRAFQLGPGAESSLTYLDSRENKLGGYDTTIVTFHPRDSREKSFPVLLYVALPSSRLYIGPAPFPQMATEIAEAIGHCGYNAEYLLRLANFMREHLPDVWDEHLYHLEHLVKARLKERNLCEEDVMTDLQIAAAITAGGIKDASQENNRLEFITEPKPQENRLESVTQPAAFSSKVPARKLRCLNL